MASVLSLADARDYLGITGPAEDVRLTAVIATAEAVITNRCGALQSVVRTDRILGATSAWANALALPVTPVIDLTSVTGFSGTALVVSDLHVELLSGVITYNTGAPFIERWYTVVYHAGRAACPADLLTAVKKLTKQLWQDQRGPVRRGGDDTAVGYLLPFDVEELISPYLQAGFA